MCGDLLEYLDRQALESTHIIGHSMGGKLAMIFALLHPERVRKLVAVDMAPSAYRDSGFHTHICDILLHLDLTTPHKRVTVSKALAIEFKDERLAMFLAKNIKREEGEKTFTWRCNLPVLRKYLHHLHIGLGELEIHAPCPVPVCFIKGEKSGYYLPEHETDRLLFLPHSEVVGIAAAGHWVHSDQPLQFQKTVVSFLKEVAPKIRTRL
jgi:pimeloyl-ACP methyl ester carboxylesterase